MWFEALTGFAEGTAEEVRAKIVVEGEMMTVPHRHASLWFRIAGHLLCAC